MLTESINILKKSALTKSTPELQNNKTNNVFFPRKVLQSSRTAGREAKVEK